MIKTRIKNILKTGMLAALLLVIPISAFAQEHEIEPGANDLEGLEDESPITAGDYSPNLNIQRTFVIADSQWNYDLNPQTASFSSEAQMLSGLYEGLFSYNAYSLLPEHALCTSHKISRDRKRWTFTIRDGAKFSNGDEITAQTIKDSWIRLLSNPKAVYASSLYCVEGAKDYREGKCGSENVKIVVKNKNTLVVYLTEPTEQLIYLLCHHSLVATSEKSGVYSGPFSLKSYRSGVLRMVKNEYYWDAEHVYVPGITVMQSSNDEEISFRYNNGKIDWIRSGANSNRIIDKKDIHVNTEFGTMYYFFKIRDNVWQYPEFRQALLEAFPYEEIRSEYYYPAKTFVYPLAGYPSVIGYDETNLDDAEALFAAARKKYGISDYEVLKLVIGVTSDDASQVKYAELMKKQFAPLKIDVVIESKPNSEYNLSIPDWDADLFTYGWIGDYADPMAFLDLFKGSSTLNVGNYKNDSYDKLLSEANICSDDAEYYKLLSKAEQILLDDGEVIPINYFITSNIINLDTVGGWFPNSLDLHPLKSIYIKEETNTLDGFVYLK